MGPPPPKLSTRFLSGEFQRTQDALGRCMVQQSSWAEQIFQMSRSLSLFLPGSCGSMGRREKARRQSSPSARTARRRFHASAKTGRARRRARLSREGKYSALSQCSTGTATDASSGSCGMRLLGKSSKATTGETPQKEPPPRQTPLSLWAFPNPTMLSARETEPFPPCPGSSLPLRRAVALPHPNSTTRHAAHVQPATALPQHLPGGIWRLAAQRESRRQKNAHGTRTLWKAPPGAFEAGISWAPLS